MNCLVVSMMVSLTIAGTLSVDAAPAFSCGDGWVQYQSKCYFFSTIGDEENLKSIRITCNSMDAFSAYPTNEKELIFLSSYVKRLDVYGWMTGYSTYTSTNTHKAYYYDDGRAKPITTAEVQTPEVHQDPGANSNCIAYRPNYHEYSGMTTVDCHIKLPYVCRGDRSNVTPTGKTHWLQSGTQDIFWVSDSMDKLNYSAAKQSCESKNMNLVSIRNQQILVFLDENLKSRSANKMEPWWTGLHITDARTLTWTDNVPMNESVILWLPSPTMDYFQQILLLGSGNALFVRDKSDQLAPFICMKNATTTYKYDCPSGWIRGGGSCYRRSQKDSLTWDKASQFCAGFGSHLLTIDSQDEMTWLRDSQLLRPLYARGGTWTSLNDKKTKTYLWSDGSKLDKSVADWMKPFEENLHSSQAGQCIRLSSTGELFPTRCSTTRYYGCQYQSTTGKCYDLWSYHKGYCYLTGFSSSLYKMRFGTAKAICKTLVDGSDIVPEIVKIETRDVYDFLVKAYGRSVGIGLNSLLKPGQWTWADGTKADLSVFPNITEPDNGPGEKCVAVTPNGNLFDDRCNVTKMFVCEREIKVKVKVAGGQAAHFKPSQWMAFIVFVAILKIFA